MMNIERVLNNKRLTLALTGLTPDEFLKLLPTFTTIWIRQKQKEYDNNPNRQRKPGGGRKGFLKTITEKLFFILFYYKCYPTYDVLGFFFGCNRANAYRKQCQLSKILKKTLGKKLVLPKRQIKGLEDFLKAFPEAKEVFIDGTERPIQRPEDSQKQKDNYSGKKKRHTRKNIIITDRKKQVGFLSKTVGGKKHDFDTLKDHAPPDYMPKKVKKHLDKGFCGFKEQYPGHRVSIPQRKPRNKELSKKLKEQNKKKSSERMVVEHAVWGVKRFRILTDVLRNKIKGFDDLAMLISCGLWNYHLTMS